MATPGDKIVYRRLYAEQSTQNRYYDLKEGILFTAFTHHNDYTTHEKSSLTVLAKIGSYLSSLRDNIVNRLKNKMPDSCYTLFASLFLGAPDTGSAELKEHFNAWGIAHYLARSGLHVIIMLLIWNYLLRYVPMGLIKKNLLLSLVLVVCSALSWSSVSFTRALLSYLMGTLLFMSGFQQHALNMISFICLLILVYNPFYLFFLNFQLSFGLTCVLAWLHELTLQTQRSRYGHNNI
jgi:competence protein ComEC